MNRYLRTVKNGAKRFQLRSGRTPPCALRCKKYLPEFYTICRICLKIILFADKAYILSAQILGNGAAIPKARDGIVKRSHIVTAMSHRGMVLAIPLMQAAVGPSRSV